MVFEIFTQGDAALLRDVFNAISTIVGQSSYMTLLEIMLIFGLFWVLLEVAFKQNYRHLAQWFIFFFITMNVMLVPKVDILITNTLYGTHQYAVSNVPLGLAFPASISSKIGNTLTHMTEAVFSLPDDLKYQKTGTLMASNLVTTASQFRITNADFAANIRSFMQQCVQYDLLLGKYTFQEVLTSDNLWGLFSRYASPARSFLYYDIILTCKEGISKLHGDWEQELETAMPTYAKRFFGPESINPQGHLMQYLPISYQYMVGMSKTASEIMQQNMLINAFEEGIMSYAGQVGAAAAVNSYAYTRAMQQQRSGYQISGQMGSNWLSVMKIVFDMLFYGAFIIFFPLILMPNLGVSILKNFLMSLFTLQTWAPLYAILNLAMTSWARAQTMAASSFDSLNALTISTLPGVEQINANVAVVAGYISMSIPFLAYALVRQGAGAFTHVATQLGSVTQTATLHGAEEATSGNYSLANVSMQNLNAYNTSSFKSNDNVSYESGMTSFQTQQGAMVHQTERGGIVMDAARATALSTLPMSVNFSDSLQSSFSNMAEDSQSLAQTHLSAAAQSHTSALREMYDFAHNRGVSQSSDTAYTDSLSVSTQQALNDYQSHVERFAKSHNISESESANLLAGVHAELNWKGISLPFNFKLGGGGKIEGNIAGDARRQAQFDEARDYINQTNFSETVEQAQRGLRDEHYRMGNDESERVVSSINSSWDEAQSLRDEASIQLSQAEHYRESASYVESQSANINSQANQHYVDWLVEQTPPGQSQGRMNSTQIEEIQKNPVVNSAYMERFIAEEGHKFVDLSQSPMINETKSNITKSSSSVETAHQNQYQQLQETHSQHDAQVAQQGASVASSAPDSHIAERIDNQVAQQQNALQGEQQGLYETGEHVKQDVKSEQSGDKSLITKAVKNFGGSNKVGKKMAKKLEKQLVEEES